MTHFSYTDASDYPPKNNFTKYKFPEKQVVSYMFCSKTNIVEAILPSTYKIVDRYAFWSAKNLEKFIGNEGLEKIDEFAFASCIMLNTVKLPSTLKAIEPYAFKDCIRLKKLFIPYGVEKFSVESIKGCLNLEEITCKKEVAKLLKRSAGCPSLKIIHYLDENNKVIISLIMMKMIKLNILKIIMTTM